MTVTIHCDMGEGFGILGDDETCMPYVTHANIACRFHASDPMVMRRTVQEAKRHGIMIGSHPGLPDREGFGRREMRLRRWGLVLARPGRYRLSWQPKAWIAGLILRQIDIFQWASASAIAVALTTLTADHRIRDAAEHCPPPLPRLPRGCR
jgi:hypothetical protein